MIGEGRIMSAAGGCPPTNPLPLLSKKTSPVFKIPLWKAFFLRAFLGPKNFTTKNWPACVWNGVFFRERMKSSHPAKDRIRGNPIESSRCKQQNVLRVKLYKDSRCLFSYRFARLMLYASCDGWWIRAFIFIFFCKVNCVLFEEIRKSTQHTEARDGWRKRVEKFN